MPTAQAFTVAPVPSEDPKKEKEDLKKNTDKPSETTDDANTKTVDGKGDKADEDMVRTVMVRVYASACLPSIDHSLKRISL